MEHQQIVAGSRVRTPSRRCGTCLGWVSDTQNLDNGLIPSIEWDSGTVSAYRNYRALELLPQRQLSLLEA